MYNSRRGDKFDLSMTRGNLLDNNTTLFIFISSNDDPTLAKGHRKQTTEPIFGKKNQLQSVEWESVTYRLITHSSCPLS